MSNPDRVGILSALVAQGAFGRPTPLGFAQNSPTEFV